MSARSRYNGWGKPSVKRTAHHAHLDDADVSAAAQRVGDLIAGMLAVGMQPAPTAPAAHGSTDLIAYGKDIVR